MLYSSTENGFDLFLFYGKNSFNLWLDEQNCLNFSSQVAQNFSHFTETAVRCSSKQMLLNWK